MHAQDLEQLGRDLARLEELARVDLDGEELPGDAYPKYAARAVPKSATSNVPRGSPFRC